MIENNKNTKGIGNNFEFLCIIETYFNPFSPSGPKSIPERVFVQTNTTKITKMILIRILKILHPQEAIMKPGFFLIVP